MKDKEREKRTEIMIKWSLGVTDIIELGIHSEMTHTLSHNYHFLLHSQTCLYALALIFVGKSRSDVIRKAPMS